MVLYGAKTIRELKDKLDIYAEMHGKIKSSTKQPKIKRSTRARKIKMTENKDAKHDGKRCYNCGDSNKSKIVIKSRSYSREMPGKYERRKEEKL